MPYTYDEFGITFDDKPTDMTGVTVFIKVGRYDDELSGCNFVFNVSSSSIKNRIGELKKEISKLKS